MSQIQVPKGWKEVTTSDVIEDPKNSIRIGPFGSLLKKHELTDSGIRVIFIENVVNNRFEFKTGKFITKEKFEQLKGFSIKPNDVLVTMMGTIGRICVVPENIGKAIISSHLTKITLDQRKILPEYFSLLLLSPIGKEQMFREARGIAMPGLNSKIIKNLKFLLPPLETQKKIIQKLDYILGQLEEKKKEILKTKQKFNSKVLVDNISTSILDNAVSGRLTNSWRENNNNIESAKSFLTKVIPHPFDYEETPDLPTGWILCKLNAISKLITKGSSPKWQGVNYVDDGILFVTSENVRNGKLRLENKKYVEEKFNSLQKRSILEKGDILTNIVGASIGRSAIFNENEAANINQAVALIRLYDKINRQYVSYVLNSSRVLQFMHDNKVDVARANLSLADVNNFPIPFPPPLEQNEIVNKVMQKQNEITNVELIVKSIDQKNKEVVLRIDGISNQILSSALLGKLVN